MSGAFPRTLRIFLLLAAGALAMRAAVPVAEALAGPGVPLVWWTARAFGLLAWIALWLSALFGVFMAGKGAGGLLDKAWVAELHGRWSVAALVATVVHVLAIVADPVSGVTPIAAIAPFTSATLTGPVALGTLALWGLALVAVSTALSRRLSRVAWRAIHASAFGTLLLGLVHGISAGTDTSAAPVRLLYLITTGLLVAAATQRLLLATRGARGPARGAERS